MNSFSATVKLANPEQAQAKTHKCAERSRRTLKIVKPIVAKMKCVNAAIRKIIEISSIEDYSSQPGVVRQGHHDRDEGKRPQNFIL